MKKNVSKNQTANDDGSYVVEKKNRKWNIFAFVLCVFASFFVWLYVMNTQNSDYTKTFSLSAEIINEEKLLAETGLSLFGEPERQISVTIQGKKADIKKYSEKDFRAYVDVSTIDEVGHTAVSVSVETPTAAVKVISVEPKTLAFYADRTITKEIALSAHCDEGRYTLSASPATITVSGPQTYVEKIASARVVVPHDDDYTQGHKITSSDIQMYDANEQQLSSLYITFNEDKITVKVEAINE